MITGAVKLAGVIGWPVKHSLSPRLHNYWLNYYAIDGVYIPMAVAPEHLEQAVRSLPLLGFRGFNVTVPHKETILPYLDSIDELAKSIGAVNTVIVNDKGELHGTNTDAYGFMENLRQAVTDIKPYLKNVVILGAGGASRAIIKGLLDAGAENIIITNRTSARAEALVAHFADNRLRSEEKPKLSNANLVINTTSAGLHGNPALDISLTDIPAGVLVTDIVYAPLETRFLVQAKAAGLKTVDGLGMLIYQAVPGFESWFGTRPEVTKDIRKHLLS